MKIGLFFGTFNPIHIGHLIIANHLAENSELDAVWFVITPHSPFKKKKNLLDNHHRLAMVRIAVEDYSKLQASDIEFGLPRPNYTVHTLAYLSEKYPQHEFTLIMGSDNIQGFHKWKNYEFILENHKIFIYPRLTETPVKTQFDNHTQVHFVEAPIIEISATAIRKAVKDKKDIRPLLPQGVWQYLDHMNFYK